MRSSALGSDLRAKDLATPAGVTGERRHENMRGLTNRSYAASTTRCAGRSVAPSCPWRLVACKRKRPPTEAALLLVSTRLPKELVAIGATEDSNRPLGGADRVNKGHPLAAGRTNRRQFGFLLRHRTRTQEQRAWFLFFRPFARHLGWSALKQCDGCCNLLAVASLSHQRAMSTWPAMPS
jgi:hypothetical protein